ncbi:AlpA family phage regulatory protein [Thiopseudomonas acetoxidans]
MNPTTQPPTNSVHPARQQRILRLPEVKAKTGFGRSTIYALMAAG